MNLEEIMLGLFFLILIIALAMVLWVWIWEVGIIADLFEWLFPKKRWGA